MERTSIQFKTTDGLTLRGWLYHPLNKNKAMPAIAMSHGFACIKEQSLDKFAKKFCDNGLVVLVWDNRNFGESDGEPRQHIDVVMQRRDYRDALTYLSQQSFVDENRMGLWGFSLSGGNVLAVAAQDKRVKVVVANVPAMQFWLERNQYMLPIEINSLKHKLQKDREARFRGEPYETMKVVDPEKGQAAFWNDKRSIEFFMSADQWINKVTVASFDYTSEYDIENLIDKISPTPLLIVAATEDQLIPIAMQIKAFEKAMHPKELLLLKGDHFSLFYEDEYFHQAADAALGWFKKHI